MSPPVASTYDHLALATAGVATRRLPAVARVEAHRAGDSVWRRALGRPSHGACTFGGCHRMGVARARAEAPTPPS
jgi:hypothetical protein